MEIVLFVFCFVFLSFLVFVYKYFIYLNILYMFVVCIIVHCYMFCTCAYIVICLSGFSFDSSVLRVVGVCVFVCVCKCWLMPYLMMCVLLKYMYIHRIWLCIEL